MNIDKKDWLALVRLAEDALIFADKGWAEARAGKYGRWERQGYRDGMHFDLRKLREKGQGK